MLGSLGRMFVEVGANLDGLKRGLAEAEGVVKGFGGVVQKHGKAIGATMTGIGVSSLAIAYKSTSAFANFDQAMMNTQSIAVGTSDQFDAMRKQALQMSATMPHSATEIANGYYYLASAGLEANNIMKVTPTALKLATAAGADFTTTADSLTSVVMAMGYSFEDTDKVADVLQNTVKGFKTTLPELAGSLKYAMPAAQALGVSLQDLNASIGILRNNGMAAEQAGTTMRMMFTKLATISPEVSGQLSQLGFEIQKNADGSLNYTATMESLKSAIEKVPDPLQRTALLAKMFGAETANGAQILLNNVDAIEQYSGKLGEAGAVTAAFDIQMEGAGNKLKAATNAMDAASIKLGEAMAPATLLAADAMSGLAGFVSDLPEPLQQVAGMGLLAAGGIGSIGGPLMMMVASAPGAITALKAMGLAMSGLNLAFLTSPIGIAIMAIIAALLLLKFAWDNNLGGIQEKVQVFWEALGQFFDWLIGGVQSAIQTALDWFGSLKGGLVLLLGPIGAVIFAFQHWEEIKEMVSKIFDSVLEYLGGLWDRFKQAGGALMNALKEGIQGAVSAPVNAVKTGLDRLRSMLPHSDAKEGPLSDLTESGRKMMETFASGMDGAGNIIGSTFAANAPQPAAVGAAPAGAATNNSSFSVNIQNVTLSKDYGFNEMLDDIRARRMRDGIRFI